jgi:hypothetical protein
MSEKLSLNQDRLENLQFVLFVNTSLNVAQINNSYYLTLSTPFCCFLNLPAFANTTTARSILLLKTSASIYQNIDFI